MIDILEYMVPKQALNPAAFHLAVAGAGGQPLFTIQEGNVICDMKGAGGFPWDINTFDEEFIYQSITEVDWETPTTFKMFASTSRTTGNGGIVWAPRFVNRPGFNPPIVTADSTYRTYSACGTYTTSNLGGPVMTQVEGPYSINFGGTIGQQSALIQKYFWGWKASLPMIQQPGYLNMEVNYYVIGLGHVQWELHTLVNGLYTLQQTSAFNTKVSGGAPGLVFPCGIPTI